MWNHSNKKAATGMCYSFVYTVMTYASESGWCCAFQSRGDWFRTLQNKIIKNIFSKYVDCETSFFNSFKILYHPDVYRLWACTCMFQVLYLNQHSSLGSTTLILYLNQHSSLRSTTLVDLVNHCCLRLG